MPSLLPAGFIMFPPVPAGAAAALAGGVTSTVASAKWHRCKESVMVPFRALLGSSDQANSRKRVPSSLTRIARTFTTPFVLRISIGGL